MKRLETRHKYPVGLAMRSSAVKEDGKASFAGQYKTLLNVKKSELLTGYRQIIAGKYSAQALFYRISRGILDSETPMAVLVLEMIDSTSSGVIYTRDIEDQTSENILIHSIWGQGGLLVEGEVSPDLIRVSKKNPGEGIHIKTADKLKQMVLGTENSTRTIDMDRHREKIPSLDETSAMTLARWGICLENHFKQPQDIEWCQDKSGNLFILQSRPLNLPEETALGAAAPKDPPPCGIPNKLIVSHAETVCSGIGSGPVYRIEDLSQTDKIPAGSVLVTRYASPQLVTAIPSITAIVIAVGSRASHFSSIAREFGVPAVTNVGKGFEDLVHKNLVTVDAGRGMVFDGRAEALIQQAKPIQNDSDDSSFRVKLQYVMNFCTKLKLTDPESGDFTPESCRSLHDIIRFTHETALREMFSIGTRKGSRKKGARKLVSQIPMLFYVLDVGSGTEESHNTPVLTPENITSVPMKSILRGLSNPGICWSEASHFDWEEYDRIVMAGGIISADSAQFGSYAVLSRDYLNVNFRFGYHFVIIDTICSASKEDNYIFFRFSGGGGSPEGRLLRADFIKTVLTRLGFMVGMKSDLIDAEFKHGSLRVMQRTLDMVGRLLGATKLMDMYIKENADLDVLIDDFMNGRYDFRSAVDKTVQG
jgi:pyruvate,water dikinase